MKKIIKKIKDWFSDSFNLLKKNSELAVKVTAKLKEIVESPVADIAVNLSPSNIDNAALIAIRKYIPKVAFKMALAHQICEESFTPNEAIGKLINYLKGLKLEARAAFWVQFAGELNLAFSDGKLTFPEAVMLSQMVYIEIYGSDKP